MIITDNDYYFISKNSSYRIERCSTFGSPRVGNYYFKAEYNSRVRCKRFLNGADTVAKVPFSLPTLKKLNNWVKPYWMDYRHAGELIAIGQELTIVETLFYIPRGIFGNMFDHFCWFMGRTSGTYCCLNRYN